MDRQASGSKSIHGLAVIITLIVLFSIQGISVSAQPVRLETSLDTNRVKIGEWAKYTVKATHDTGIVLNWPVFSDSLNNLEIVKKSKIDTAFRGNTISKQQTLSITSWDSGYYVIPPILLSYRHQKSSTLDTLRADPASLRVHSVKVDTTKAIRPVKGIKDVPLTLAELWPYIAGGALLLGLAILGYYLYRRWKQQPEQPKPKITQPKRPAHEVALERLQELENKQLWESGEIKQYYIELSDIFREYIERRYTFPALEMTTGEINQTLDDLVLPVGLRNKASEVLDLADLVKFAKHIPKTEDHQAALQKTYDFVRETTPEPSADHNNSKQNEQANKGHDQIDA